MRVDLPAPFSPQIAWISPRPTASETFSSALTPGKVLVMERISRMLSSMDSVVLVLVVVRRRPAAGGGAVLLRGAVVLRECRPGPAAARRRARPVAGPEGLLGLTPGDLFGRPVAGVDELGLDVVLVDGLDREQVGRDDLDAVVVGLGVVGLRLVTLEERLGRGHGLLGEQPGVLEDRRALDTVGDQLHRGDLGVLTRDDGHRLRTLAVAVVLQRGDDAAGQTVVGREDAVDLRAVAVALGQQVLHALLRGLLLPAEGRRLLDAGLAGLDDQRAVVDVLLQGVHG